MPDKHVILLVEETCPACKEARDLLKPDIQQGKIEVVEAKEPKAQEIVKQVPDIKFVPECITEEDGKFARCNIEELIRKKSVSPLNR